jgi:hypothetical protein
MIHKTLMTVYAGLSGCAAPAPASPAWRPWSPWPHVLDRWARAQMILIQGQNGHRQPDPPERLNFII